MFKVIITILLSLMPLTALAQTTILPQIVMEVPSGRLTLTEALQISLEASPGVKQAAARIEAAQAVVDQARSALKPMVSANIGRRY
ncbi:MAG: TolC family protein, partial [Desulfuromusa sp.]|nr:TolC family protein [Desulfuromusa sp.]